MKMFLNKSAHLNCAQLIAKMLKLFTQYEYLVFCSLYGIMLT